MDMEKATVVVALSISIWPNLMSIDDLRGMGPHERAELGLIDLLEAGGSVLQVTTNIFAGLHDVLRG